MSRRLALLSVSDKAGLVDFARLIFDAGFDLVSTGGTATALRNAGLAVRDISELTGFPEMLDGRVKTLHPKVHGGLLARRPDLEHQRVAAEHGIAMIDLVVVNLYPFVATIRKPGVHVEEAIEQIDIGGPSMLRSAAKNHETVTVVCDPADYARVAGAFASAGDTSPALRRELAAKVFSQTAAYDAAIAEHLWKQVPAGDGGVAAWPPVYTVALPLAQPMRYGENPHQGAAFYRDPTFGETSLATARQLHGKELSYNNILDAEGALEMVRDFADLAAAAAVIVKHSNPCGIALGANVREAYDRARATDPDSAFGGIVAFSAEVDEAAAAAVGESFNEIVIAPSFSTPALDLLTKKKNLRLLATGPFTPKQPGRLVRGVVGGLLVMDRDLGTVTVKDLKVVTRIIPDEKDLAGLLFAWRCVKWVKSNAIVYTDREATIGIGAGQMSRVDSSNFGALKARRSLVGAFMASDAFFPFRDGVDIAAKHGVKAIIQPGGSVRDEEVIAAANEHGIAMVLTGMRHFRH